MIYKLQNGLGKIVLSLFILSAFVIACKKDKFEESKGICPEVIATNPLNGALGVPLNQIITATLNEPMDPATMGPNCFELTGPSGIILGTYNYNDVLATINFAPATPLEQNTTYACKIKSSIRDLRGNALQKDYAWSFSTGIILTPIVLDTDPDNLTTGVLKTQVIKAFFNYPMDPNSITDSSFKVTANGVLIQGSVACIDSTATFTPNILLQPSTIYVATITTNAKTLNKGNMPANYSWTFTTEALIPPVIISTTPLHNATGVSLIPLISAKFSVPMNGLTIKDSSFYLMEGTNKILGSISYSDSIAIFTPSAPLSVSKVYVATITTLVKNIEGAALPPNYSWTFTTDSPLPPTVVFTDPISNATEVGINKTVRARFSAQMDPSTLIGSNMILTRAGNPVAGVVTYVDSTITFNPISNLLPNTLYTCTITTGVKNQAGTAMAANYVWTFTTLNAIPPTVISTDPINLATNVLLNKVVTATFSEAMDVTSLTNATFTLKIGATTVAGVVNMIGNTARFTPTLNLLSGNTYTATIKIGAQNLAGTNLANDFVWTFSTKAPAGPIAPNLNTVARFGIIAGVGVSNNAGFSVINNMDVGISPGARTGVTGFPPATIVNGAIYASDDITPPGTPAMLIQAKADLTAAYLFARDAVLPAPATVSGDQGGLTLAPGIYKSATTLLVQNGNLTLDAQGDVNAVWIFQIGSALTTIGSPTGGSIILSGGAQAKNIYWQVGSSATIGDNTQFKGNVLALTSITMNSNAVLTGRILCSNGAVVMTSTNIINKP